MPAHQGGERVWGKQLHSQMHGYQRKRSQKLRVPMILKSRRGLRMSRRERRWKWKGRWKRERRLKREKESKSPLRKLVNSKEGEDGDAINLP
jgi:hypothetical protein